MHISFHMGTLRGAGSERVGKLLLRGFSVTRPDLWAHASIWTPPHWQDEPALTCVGAHHTMRPGAFGKLWGENISLRRDLQRTHADALISFGDTSLVHAPIPHVLLVQQAYLVSDLGALDFPLPALWRAKMEAMQRYFALGARRVRAFAVQTQFMKDLLCARYDIDPARVHVVGSPLSLPAPQTQPNHPNKNAQIICVSGTGPHKNLALLPPMLKHLHTLIPDVVCNVTLERAQAPDLVAWAERLGVSAHLRFVGRLPYAACIDWMRRADVCVLPSRLESFCYPLHEALALGRPVVASDRPFAQEAATHTTSLANPDDPRAFADAIAHTLTTKKPPTLTPSSGLSPEDAASRYWSLVQSCLE